MQSLMVLETERDLITACRLINLFRRKGISLVSLGMAPGSTGLAVTCIVEAAATDAEHLFNVLRRTEGVLHVAYYRNVPASNASFVFLHGDAAPARVAQFLQDCPGSMLVFASQGKYLIQIPADWQGGLVASSVREGDFVPFACVKAAGASTSVEPLTLPGG